MKKASKKTKGKANVVQRFTPPPIGGDTDHSTTGGSGCSTSRSRDVGTPIIQHRTTPTPTIQPAATPTPTFQHVLPATAIIQPAAAPTRTIQHTATPTPTIQHAVPSTVIIQPAAAPNRTIQPAATPTSSASSSQEPVVDFWANYPEIHYLHSIIPNLKRGFELPPEPPIERRPVLTLINDQGYQPSKYHEDALRITRIIIQNNKYSWAHKWKQHDPEKRDAMFGLFKLYFDVPNWFIKDWCTKAAIVFKNKMKCLRKAVAKRPSLANKLDPRLIEAWATEDWKKKSAQGVTNRGKNPCGPRQNFIGRNGWRKLFLKFKKEHGRDPTPTEGIHLRHRRHVKTTVTAEDGTTQEFMTIEHANPYVDSREKEVQVRLAAMRLNESQSDTPMEISVLEEQKVIAEVFGISSRGKCLGLGPDVEVVVPKTRARLCEDSESTSQLKGKVTLLENEMKAQLASMDTLKARLAIMDTLKAELAAMSAWKAQMDLFVSQPLVGQPTGSTASTDQSLTHT